MRDAEHETYKRTAEKHDRKEHEAYRRHADRHEPKEEETPAPDAPPAAGPHAEPHLTEPEKTPGAGSLPDPDNPHEGDATTG